MVECGVGGNGYWSDERTWVYDLTQRRGRIDLPFHAEPGLTTLAGEKIAAADPIPFRRRSAHPSQPARAGSTLDEDQVFILRLNGAAQADSIAAHGRCEAEGIHEQIPRAASAGVERSASCGNEEPVV
jgi:alpha-2-macroglobulin